MLPGLLLLLLCLALAPTPSVAARYGAIVVEADSGRVLYEAYADDRRYPASLTKMMTLYLLFEALEKKRYSIDGYLPVSARAEGMPPSKLGLRRGSKIKIRDLILALITKSANDAAVVVAESLAKSEVEFAKLMTAKAKKLGMTHTEFRNASGLPNSYQKTTARDMATLARALIRDFPQYYPYFSTRKFSFNGRSYGNHNSLLKSYSGADGIKTGYIRASGFNLVASAERGGHRLIAVVFGGKTSRSRDKHIADLLNRGFAEVAQAVLEPPGAPRRNPFQLAANDTETPATAAAAPTLAALADDDPAGEEALAEDVGLTGDLIGDEELADEEVGDEDLGTEEDLGTDEDLAENQTTEEPAEDGAVITADAELTTATDIATLIPAVVESAGVVTDTAATEPTATEPAGIEPIDPASTWGIQVGAFSTFQPAHSATAAAQARLPEMLVETKTVIRQVNANGNQLYRAQLIGLTEPKAREVCRLLKSAQQSCIVVPPQRAAQGSASNAG